MKEQPFYIGQKVICIQGDGNDHCSLIKDQEYAVLNVRLCICGFWHIDVGLRHRAIGTECYECGVKEISKIMWCSYKMFAPIQEGFQSISYEKIMEKEIVGVN